MSADEWQRRFDQSIALEEARLAADVRDERRLITSLPRGRRAAYRGVGLVGVALVLVADHVVDNAALAWTVTGGAILAIVVAWFVIVKRYHRSMR